MVVSEETRGQGHILNRMRAKRGLGPVSVVVVPMVNATNGTRISTTKIRNQTMDVHGNAV